VESTYARSAAPSVHAVMSDQRVSQQRYESLGVILDASSPVRSA